MNTQRNPPGGTVRGYVMPIPNKKNRGYHTLWCDSLCFLEQVKGVEPSYQAWEACVLPMNYTCIFRQGRGQKGTVI